MKARYRRVHKEAAPLIRKLEFEKHPEGGYFKQTYKSDMVVNVEGYDWPRNISTTIYYMLVGGQFSAFHRMKSDELWHHYAGSALVLYTIDKDGKLLKIKISARGRFQAAVKADTWFAAALDNKRSYCLLGCTVSPGFDYRDWKLARKDDLVRTYPQHRALIERYTK
jgi:hypothetical protein